MVNGILSTITPIQSATLVAAQAKALKRKKTKVKHIVSDFSRIAVGVPLIKTTADIIKSVK